MRRPTRILALTLLAAAGCGPGDEVVVSPTGGIDDVRLAAAGEDTANWLTHGRTYSEQRFSPLTQINDATVARLGLMWSLELGSTRGLEATPLVVDGVIYTTGVWSVVYAIDARTGEQLWTYDPQVPRTHGRFACCDVVNRGAALYRGKLYVGTIDGRLIAIDAETGAPVWTVQTTPLGSAYTITGAPRIARGMVIIGNGGAELGVRGYVTAYDAETGEQMWRTYTVPGNPADGFESEAMERAAETWSGEWWVAGGGGTAWDAIVFDPELDLVFVGTGNGSPWPRDLRSPGGGDNLYLSSILALRASDGSLAWYHQTTPGDHWDYTATQPLMLAELEIDGLRRSVIMQAPKNGFFYVLDRATGEVISARTYAKISWATGFDTDEGRPIEAPDAYRGTAAVVVAPGPQGAHNWHPMAYSPLTGLVYLPIRDDNYSLHPTDVDWSYEPRWWNTGRDPLYEGPMRDSLAERNRPVGRLLAWDPVEQREVWGVTLPVVQGGGVLATAGNLVFAGSGSGVLVAYRADDGSPLWEFDARTGIIAPPVSYLVDGVQYVTVMAGWGGSAGLSGGAILGPVKPGYGRVLTFALDANAAFAPPPFGNPAQTAPAITIEASADMLLLGERLYGNFCSTCHGVPGIRGPLPDLAYSTMHEQLEAIVLRGERQALGMPSFEGLITPEQLRAIQAFVLSRATAQTR